LACEKLNRRWIGIEISEKYCEIAKQRIKQEADQMKLFEGDCDKEGKK
jgi:DNA modification methylase